MGISNGFLTSGMDSSVITSKGDLVAGTGSGAVARQAIGTDGKVLMADSTQSTGMKWETAPAPVVNAPTIQRFTSGSGTYTTPANVKYIVVEMVGGGGGGSGSCNGTGNGGSGTSGGTTTFGTSLLTANGGGGATGASTQNAGTGAILGTVNSPAITIINVRGGAGANGTLSGATASYVKGVGNGGPSFFGGNISPSGSGFPSPTSFGTGVGGPGGTVFQGYYGAGGGGGSYLKALIASPSATYSYSIGAGGTGGAAGTGGQAATGGDSGCIIVTEYYI